MSIKVHEFDYRKTWNFCQREQRRLQKNRLRKHLWYHKQWGFTVQHRGLYPISWGRTGQKIVWEKECIYMYDWHTAEIHTTLNQIFCNKDKK